MSTQLTYKLDTNPFPIQASDPKEYRYTCVISLEATNKTGADVTVSAIEVKIMVGLDDVSLTDDSSNIGPVSPDGWNTAVTRAGEGYIRYIFQPGSDPVTLPNNSSVRIYLNNVQTNTVPGVTEITALEISAAGPADSAPQTVFKVTKYPNGWGQISFWANPPLINAGQSSVIYWAGPARATYTLEFYTVLGGSVKLPNDGQPKLGPIGRYPAQNAQPIILQDSTPFTLSVSEAMDDGTHRFSQIQKTVTVITNLPLIYKFTGEIKGNPKDGFHVVLTWLTDGDNCRISGDSTLYGQKSKPSGYIIPVSKTQPLASQFTLTALNSKGQTTSTLYVKWSAVAYDGPRQLSAPAAYDMQYGPVYCMDLNNVVYQLDPFTLKPSPNMYAAGKSGFTQSSIAVTPDGNRICVGTSGDNSMTIIDSSMQWVGSILTGVTNNPGTVAIAISPDGSNVYAVACDGNFGIYPVAVLRSQMDPVKAVGGQGTFSLTISRDSTKVYAFLQQGINIYDRNLDNVVTINTDLPPFGIALSSDNKRIFIATGTGDTNSQAISSYVASSNTTYPYSFMGKFGYSDGSIVAMGMSLDNRLLYIMRLNYDGIYYLGMYDPNTFEAIVPSAPVDGGDRKMHGGYEDALHSSLPGGQHPVAVALTPTPDGCTMYVGVPNVGGVSLLRAAGFTGGVKGGSKQGRILNVNNY